MEIKAEKKYKAYDSKIALLETDVMEKQVKIDTLTQIIVNMQSSLNHIDSGKRVNNIIISGLTEGDIEYNEFLLTTNADKVKCLLEVLGVGPTNEQLNTFGISRIGQPRSNQTRLIKLNVKSKDIRKIILEKAPSLKNYEVSWNKVYLKKDLHPVFIKENQKIRKSEIHKKMKLLKEQNTEKSVKIVKGYLMVDDVIVDKNIFFV